MTKNQIKSSILQIENELGYKNINLSKNTRDELFISYMNLKSTFSRARGISYLEVSKAYDYQ